MFTVLWTNCSGPILDILAVFSLIKISFSSIFDIEFNSDIGRWFIGYFVSFPGLGSIIIEFSFQKSGKYSRHMQPLKM